MHLHFINSAVDLSLPRMVWIHKHIISAAVRFIGPAIASKCVYVRWDEKMHSYYYCLRGHQVEDVFLSHYGTYLTLFDAHLFQTKRQIFQQSPFFSPVAQLVKHCTAYAKVMSSIPGEHTYYKCLHLHTFYILY